MVYDVVPEDAKPKTSKTWACDAQGSTLKNANAPKKKKKNEAEPTTRGTPASQREMRGVSVLSTTSSSSSS